MTNEQLLEDLKQFVGATVSQATANLATKDEISSFKADVNERFEAIDKRFDDVETQLNEIQNAVGAELVKAETTAQDHERRIQRLEARAA